MNRILPCTACDTFNPFFKTNIAPAAYGTIPPVQGTDPVQNGNTSTFPDNLNNGVLSMDDSQGVMGGNFAGLDFFGTGVNGTFNTRLIGWKRVKSGLFAPQWRSFLIADLLVTLASATLGTSNGLATTSRPYSSAMSVALTIAVNSSLILPGNDQQPASTTPASNLLWIDIRGVNAIQMVVGTGTAADANGLLYLL